VRGFVEQCAHGARPPSCGLWCVQGHHRGEEESAQGEGSFVVEAVTGAEVADVIGWRSENGDTLGQAHNPRLRATQHLTSPPFPWRSSVVHALGTLRATCQVTRGVPRWVRPPFSAV